ncbi:hypothetical protein SNE40_011645 [Patella caerulea]|uniref:G-protein coupled receptors family 1 profile domain-containing protein n=1 Tax=Patella caerulea TaxID=87958 RepID=A0AAN8JQG0_PATCE
MTLTVMSIERWVAILYPLKAKYLCTYSHARLVLFIVWAFSFITAIPVLIGQKHVLVGVKIKAYWCVKNWPSSKIEIVFEVYMLVLMFVIPMTVMIVAYAGICKELLALSSTRANLRVSSGKLVQQQSSSSNNGNQRAVVPVYNQPDIIYTKTKPKRTKTDDVDDKTIKVIQMLIVVVVLFSVCWGPILINNVLVAVGVIERFHYDYLKPMRQAFFLMSYFNSCSNPIVYGFMSKHFRQSFKRAILSWFCCSKRKQLQKIRYSLNATRSTALCSGRSSCSHSSKNRNKFSEDYRTEMPSPIMGIKSKSNKT